MNNEMRHFVKPFIIINLILTLATTLLLLPFNYHYSLGFLLGSIFSFITFIIHAYSVNNFGKDDNRAFIKSFSGAMLRFLLSGIALLIAFFFDLFNIYSTFAGLVVIKFVMIIYAVIYTKHQKKEAK